MLLVTALALAGTGGGYRLAPAEPVLAASLREALVINPGDEQLIGSFVRGDFSSERVQLGVTSGFTHAWNPSTAWTRTGVALTSVEVLYWYRHREDPPDLDPSGAPIPAPEVRHARAFGVEVGWADPEFRGWSTVGAESTGGLRLGFSTRRERDGAETDISYRFGVGVVGENPTEVPLYLENTLVVVHDFTPALQGVGEAEILLFDPVPLSFRGLARYRAQPGMTLDAGLQLPIYYGRSASYATAQLVAKVTLCKL